MTAVAERSGPLKDGMSDLLMATMLGWFLVGDAVAALGAVVVDSVSDLDEGQIMAFWALPSWVVVTFGGWGVTAAAMRAYRRRRGWA